MQVTRDAWLSWMGFLTVGIAYALSFFLPALSIPLLNQPAMDRFKAEVGARAGGDVLKVEGPSAHVVKGYQCFRIDQSLGWVHVTAWSANPFLWVGCLLLLLRQWRWSALAGCTALGLGSVAFVMAAITFSDLRADVRWSVTDYQVGYWLWLASMALLAAFGIAGWWSRKQREVIPNQVYVGLETSAAEPKVADITTNVKPRLHNDGTV